MNRAAHYRYQAKHARQLADAAWQLDLQDMLRSLARITTRSLSGVTKISHAERQVE
jgi:hypothetical protein